MGWPSAAVPVWANSTYTPQSPWVFRLGAMPLIIAM